MKHTAFIIGLPFLVLIAQSLWVATERISWRYELQRNGRFMHFGNHSGDYFLMWADWASSGSEFEFVREAMDPKIGGNRAFWGSLMPAYRPKKIYLRHAVRIPSWILIAVSSIPIWFWFYSQPRYKKLATEQDDASKPDPAAS